MELTMLESFFIHHSAFNRKYNSSLQQNSEEIWSFSIHRTINYIDNINTPSLSIYLGHTLQQYYPKGIPRYHNLYHALCVASTARELVRNTRGTFTDEECRRESKIAFLAGLFHDAGYSLQVTDAENVKRASEIFTYIATQEGPLNKFLFHNKIAIHEVTDIILCTQFDKETQSFPIEPTSKAAKAVRDADLLGFMDPYWPALMVGLAIEMGINPRECGEVKFMLTRQLAFLEKKKPYIDIGWTHNAREAYFIGLRKILKEI